jgi:hypothetical protein
MNDNFKKYTLHVFNDLNISVSKKFDDLESKEIERNINTIMKIEETFNEIDKKLDSSINHLIKLKLNKDIYKDLNYIN